VEAGSRRPSRCSACVSATGSSARNRGALSVACLERLRNDCRLNLQSCVPPTFTASHPPSLRIDFRSVRSQLASFVLVRDTRHLRHGTENNNASCSVDLLGRMHGWKFCRSCCARHLVVFGTDRWGVYSDGQRGWMRSAIFWMAHV